LIEFSEVCKEYKNGIKVLDNVNFKIENGEFIFVIGKSGAGKSTMIKLLTCEERPTSGKVLIDQYNISSVPSKYVPFLRRNIGMIFQDFRLINTKTVFSNVSYAMEIVGASKKEIHRRVPIVLSIVGLRDKALVRPCELSGGEQQRVAIARALVNNPKIILADEPTGNLDPSNSEMIMTILEQINCTGTTIIICTHDLGFVNRMKRRVIEIEEGHLVRDECQGEYFRNLAIESI
jgi:cell division ATP-binding protein FtsE